MPNNRPPQLQLSLPAASTSFKRSFQEYGFDLADSPTAGTDASGSTQPDRNDRFKRARSRSSFEDGSGSPSSSQSSTLTSGSNRSVEPPAEDNHGILSGLSTEAPLSVSLSLPIINTSPLQPPRLPTPEIQDIEMSDYRLVEASNTSIGSPPSSAHTDEVNGPALSGLNDFNEQNSPLRGTGISSRGPSPPPPILPPLALSEDQPQLSTNAISFLQSSADLTPALSSSSLELLSFENTLVDNSSNTQSNVRQGQQHDDGRRSLETQSSEHYGESSHSASNPFSSPTRPSRLNPRPRSPPRLPPLSLSHSVNYSSRYLPDFIFRSDSTSPILPPLDLSGDPLLPPFASRTRNTEPPILPPILTEPREDESWIGARFGRSEQVSIDSFEAPPMVPSGRIREQQQNSPLTAGPSSNVLRTATYLSELRQWFSGTSNDPSSIEQRDNDSLSSFFRSSVVRPPPLCEPWLSATRSEGEGGYSPSHIRTSSRTFHLSPSHSTPQSQPGMPISHSNSVSTAHTPTGERSFAESMFTDVRRRGDSDRAWMIRMLSSIDRNSTREPERSASMSGRHSSSIRDSDLEGQGQGREPEQRPRDFGLSNSPERVIGRRSPISHAAVRRLDEALWRNGAANGLFAGRTNISQQYGIRGDRVEERGREGPENMEQEEVEEDLGREQVQDNILQTGYGDAVLHTRDISESSRWAASTADRRFGLAGNPRLWNAVWNDGNSDDDNLMAEIEELLLGNEHAGPVNSHVQRELPGEAGINQGELRDRTPFTTVLSSNVGLGGEQVPARRGLGAVLNIRDHPNALHPNAIRPILSSLASRSGSERQLSFNNPFNASAYARPALHHMRSRTQTSTTARPGGSNSLMSENAAEMRRRNARVDLLRRMGGVQEELRRIEALDIFRGRSNSESEGQSTSSSTSRTGLGLQYEAERVLQARQNRSEIIEAHMSRERSAIPTSGSSVWNSGRPRADADASSDEDYSVNRSRPWIPGGIGLVRRNSPLRPSEALQSTPSSNRPFTTNQDRENSSNPESVIYDSQSSSISDMVNTIMSTSGARRRDSLDSVDSVLQYLEPMEYSDPPSLPSPDLGDIFEPVRPDFGWTSSTPTAEDSVQSLREYVFNRSSGDPNDSREENEQQNEQPQLHPIHLPSDTRNNQNVHMRGISRLQPDRGLMHSAQPWLRSPSFDWNGPQEPVREPSHRLPPPPDVRNRRASPPPPPPNTSGLYRTLDPNAFGPGPFRNTVQRMVDERSRGRNVPERRVSPPAIPPLTFDELSTGYPWETSNPPVYRRNDQPNNIYHRRAESNNVTEDTVRHRHRSTSHGEFSSNRYMTPNPWPNNETTTTSQAARRRPELDLHSYLSRRVRTEASRIDDNATSNSPFPRGNTEVFDHAIEVLRHDGPNRMRSQQLIERYHQERGDAVFANEFFSSVRRDGSTNPQQQQRANAGSETETEASRERLSHPMRRRARFARQVPDVSMPTFTFRRRGRPLGDYMRDEDFDGSYESLLSLATFVGEAKPRATPDHVISSLETAHYKDWVNMDSDKRCPICLDDYEPDDAVLKLKECAHWLHKSCLQQWLKGATTCPVCRKSVYSPSPRRPSHHHHHHHHHFHSANEHIPWRRDPPGDGTAPNSGNSGATRVRSPWPPSSGA